MVDMVDRRVPSSLFSGPDFPGLGLKDEKWECMKTNRFLRPFQFKRYLRQSSDSPTC